jgi:hypothetical protein
MTPTDATTLVVPLWAAMTAGGGVLASLIGIVAWAFMTFEQKADAIERHKAMDTRVQSVEATLGRIAENVAYIRGILEPKK